MINISDSAKTYILDVVKNFNAIGLSVSAIKGGCSGMQFKFELEHDLDSNSDCEYFKIDDNVYFFIKNSALLFITGSILTYKKTMTGGMLVFEDINSKKNCSCGKSFS